MIRTNRLSLLIVAIISCIALADDPTPVTHWNFQAVHPNGFSSFDDSGPFQVVLEGILLNNPEKWLDPEPNAVFLPFVMGGEWELFVQGEGTDHAGTACWMGQNYGNLPAADDSYTDTQWLSEIFSLNRDLATGYIFRAGDRIRVTGTYLFYAGKLNINENHEIDPDFDFTVELIKPAVGLPQPEEISISHIKNSDNSDNFDSTRASGGEYYQCRLVRISDVNVIDPENFNDANTITIMDVNGLTLPVRLGRGSGISRYSCPSGQIDAIGILDQKAPGYPPNPTKGYRLLIFDYDDNGLVLGDIGHRGDLSGDINGDYIVNFEDLAELSDQWLENTAGLYPR